MPLFHFNVCDGFDLPDVDGTELPDLRTARREAVRLAGRLLPEEADKFWDGQEWKLEVTDHAGLILFRLDFTATTAPALASSE